MTYEQIDGILQSNHFYPTKVMSGGKVTALQVECSATILMDSKMKRLEQIFKEAAADVRITPMTNEGYLLVQKND